MGCINLWLTSIFFLFTATDQASEAADGEKAEGEEEGEKTGEVRNGSFFSVKIQGVENQRSLKKKFDFMF